MSNGLIYTVDSGGNLTRMNPAAPQNEDQMQELVARYPELISDGDGELLLIRREQSISDREDGIGRWSIDHLFVTQSSVPVLIELKRAVDTRLRREVVGQMLDYAANATAYWQGGNLAESFAKTALTSGNDPEQMLQEFIGDKEPAAFWSQVDSNMRAGNIKMVFVADEIPRELARIVEFLNEQMRADVRAVELKWFSGADGLIALSPRVIGETERTAATKNAGPPLPVITLQEWLETHIAPHGEATLSGARNFIESALALGGQCDMPQTQGSIYAKFVGNDRKNFFPLHLWRSGIKPTISFSMKYLVNRQPTADEEVRSRLFNELIDAVGELSSRNLKGFPAFDVEILANPDKYNKFSKWLERALPIMR